MLQCLCSFFYGIAVREDRTPGGKHRMKRVRGDLASPGGAVRTVYISDTYDDDLVQRLVEALPDLSPNPEGR